MITIQTQSLRDFQKLTQYIKPNTLLPILSNLHLTYNGANWILTKNNIGALCSSQIQAEGDPDTLLLDERILFGVLSVTKSEQIVIRREGQSIIIDTGTDKPFFQAEDPANFPLLPLEDTGDTFKLTPGILRALDIARNFTYDNEASANYQYVHVNGDCISAMHNSYFYVNNEFKGLPVFLLSREQADIVSSLEEAEYCSSESKNYFYTPGTTYVFGKCEYRPPNLSTILPRLQAQGRDFVIAKQDILDFITIANLTSDSPVVMCSMTATGVMANLKMADSSFGRGCDRQAAITGSFDEFSFNSRLLAAPLKAVPYENFNAKTNQNCLIFTGNNEYFCFIGMQK